MNRETLQAELDSAGELMIAVEEFDEPLELHRHDTEIGDDVISLELADGELTVGLNRVTGYWKHKHSLADYGLH